MDGAGGPVDDLPFTKAHGAGNDYLLVDGIERGFAPEHGPSLARSMANRHTGVGSDGLIVLAPEPGHAGRMWMWNADGSRGAMCGNGLRLLGHFARERGYAPSDTMRLATDVGPRQVELLRDGNQQICGARVAFPPVECGREALPWSCCDAALPEGVPPGLAIHPASAGNPHGVIFVDRNPAALDLAAIARPLQGDPRFPDGVNIEVVQVVESDRSQRTGIQHRCIQRTWERGSGETLACGSGALAVVAVGWATGRLRGDRVPVQLRGGTLHVERHDGGASLVLEGPTHTVCHGSWPIRSSQENPCNT